MAEYTSYWSSPFESQAKHLPTLPLPEIGVPSQITLFSQPHAGDVHYVYEKKNDSLTENYIYNVASSIVWQGNELFELEHFANDWSLLINIMSSQKLSWHTGVWNFDSNNSHHLLRVLLLSGQVEIQNHPPPLSSLAVFARMRSTTAQMPSVVTCVVIGVT